MTNKSPLFTPFLSLLLLLSATCYAKDDNLIKTKCYKTEDPVGEVCLFEDRKAVSTNKEKYQEYKDARAKHGTDVAKRLTTLYNSPSEFFNSRI